MTAAATETRVNGAFQNAGWGAVGILGFQHGRHFWSFAPPAYWSSSFSRRLSSAVPDRVIDGQGKQKSPPFSWSGPQATTFDVDVKGLSLGA
jgi:hypothetical protein